MPPTSDAPIAHLTPRIATLSGASPARVILALALTTALALASAIASPLVAQRPNGPTFAAQPHLTDRRVVARQVQPFLGARGVPILERDGLRFKDLDRNGEVDRYEDWRLTAAARARDLVARMSLGDKAGAMMHGNLRSVGPMGAVGVGTEVDLDAMRAVIRDVGITHVIMRLGGAPADLARQTNAVQELAEGSRLGIPVTISTDPRHHFQYVVGASVQTGQFSQWPEPLGLAALRDPAITKRFADIARQEYRAVGIHMTLSPQADLATEPRWSRINGTFGEDPDLALRLTRAYVEGFQHGARGVDSSGVAAVVKHWVGYGAARLGYDSHNVFGRYADIDGAALAVHVRPFLGAFAAGVAGVMPTYSILEGATINGQRVEAVGAGFSKQLVNDLLRRTHGYRGIVLSDWAITSDCTERCRNGAPAGERPSWSDVGMPWGVEDLPKVDRFVKAVRAGIDQFGGTEEAPQLVEAVRSGKLTEAQLDASVVRLMVQKFQLGLFENPYVDVERARRVVGSNAFRGAGLDAQRKALVVLENKGALLPLGRTVRRVYLHNVDPMLAASYGWRVVSDPAQADVAIMRLDAPFETLHPGWVFGAMQHEGNLGFRDGDADYGRFKAVSAVVPTIVTVYLDRPAILTPLKERARVLIGNFGVSDAALLDVVAGKARAQGKLPFALPSSMASVEAQRGDTPHDLKRPLYSFGAGIVR
ncbi:MAG: glycoside hydrolase family 3 protein [Gemmatimonadaceae bacterium]|nr:glycoside hydrolase family 3 protein [Gemmatimonadaceae bacterium]